MGCGSGTLLGPGWPPQVNIQLKQVQRSSHKRHPFRFWGVDNFCRSFSLMQNPHFKRCHLTIAGKSSHPCWKRIMKIHGKKKQALAISFFRQQRKREKKRVFPPLQTANKFFARAFIHFLTLPNAFSLIRWWPQFIVSNWQPLNLGGKQRNQRW